MTKEDIINEYIPFMVNYTLSKVEIPKNEIELTEFYQALGKHVIEQYEEAQIKQVKEPK